jgi:FAD/FMN-containing dehydrogenase
MCAQGSLSLTEFLPIWPARGLDRGAARVNVAPESSSLGEESMSAPARPDVTALRSSFAGTVLVPGDEGYDEARKIWNEEIDRRPAVIAQCATAEDVVRAVTFGAEEGLELSVRGGAHAPAGLAVVDDGLMIDLRLLNSVTVDPQARTARVGGGALLSQLVDTAQEHALATPIGAVGHTGVGGLTLGGGMGWLTRKHGLAIDNLLGCEVVTADGEVLQVDETSHPDLFWALKGGGGNFGVVTEFRFRLHPVGPMINFTLLHWPLEQGAAALRRVGEVGEALPDETSIIFGIVNAPPAPFVPEHLHMAPGYVAIVVGFGSEEEQEGVVAQLRQVEPQVDFTTPMPYSVLQTLLDEANGWGQYDYDKGLYLEHLSEGAISALTDAAAKKQSPGSVVLFYRLDGAYSAVPDDATAFSGGRSPRYACFVIAVCPTREVLEHDREWVRALHRALEPHAIGSEVYVNAVDDSIGDSGVRSAYGKVKYDRLAEVKQQYDPQNLFRRNVNVRPSTS